MKKIVEIYTIPILALLIFPLSANAFFFDKLFDELENWLSSGTSSSQIINEVKVSANTGGNVATDGEIKEGETKSQIYVKNIINGTEIDPIEIESTADTVSATSEIKADDDVVQVHRETEIDSEKKVENYEVNLDNSVTETENSAETENSTEIENSTESAPENEGSFNNFQNWWSDFVEGVKSFFQNIFSLF